MKTLRGISFWSIFSFTLGVRVVVVGDSSSSCRDLFMRRSMRSLLWRRLELFSMKPMSFLLYLCKFSLVMMMFRSKISLKMESLSWMSVRLDRTWNSMVGVR